MEICFCSGRRREKSLQFFGKDGLALHKIFLTKESNEEVFDILIERFKVEDQNQIFSFEAVRSKQPEKADSEIDVKGFKKAWTELKDTHDF